MNGHAVRVFVLAAAIAAAGAAATLAAASATGMAAGDVRDLAALLAPAAVVTAAAAAAARPLLARLSMGAALGAIGAATALFSIANLGILSHLMLVNAHDAGLVAVLLVYSLAAGAGAAAALARSTARGVEQLAGAATRLREGDLSARAGHVEAGAEVAELAGAFDAMAERLEVSLARERDIESRRRDLFSAVSHDLRTPLASLQAMVEAIDDGVADDPATLRRYVREMRRAVEVLVALVDDLFQLAQLDAAALAADSRSARLGDVVRMAVDAVEASAAAKGVRMTAAFDAAAAEPCSPRLARVVQNLLANGVRHTPPGGVVAVRVQLAGDTVEVVVEDTGEGFAPGDAERLFDPFWRGDPARAGPGAGLGLALARRIVEALGGRIEAGPAGGGGARFRVTVPAAAGR